MSYYLAKKVNLEYEDCLLRVATVLKEEGFGIVTEIDMKETLKNKIGVDFKKYKILGACNPKFAHRALLSENQLGVYLPCNVVVQESEDGGSLVSAINPDIMMQGLKNEDLIGLSAEVKSGLERMLAKL